MVKFGLSIPTLTGFPRSDEPPEGWRARWKNSFEICALAEDLGFDFGTVGHHRFFAERVDSSQPMVSLAALAARTSKLRFCTNIAVMALHHPVDIAEQVATVDEISDGRMILGVGIGLRPHEFEQIGLKYKERISRFEESIEIIRKSWGNGSFEFTSKHFTIDGADVYPKPVQKPGPPIWIGAQVEAAVSRAARLGDGWLTDNMASASALGPQAERFRQESRQAGNAGTVVLNRKIGIGSNRAKIETEWLPPILEIYRDYLRRGVPFGKDFAETLSSHKSVTLKDIPSDLIVTGTPEDCVASIEKCIAETACDYIVADFGRGAHGDRYVKLREQITMFGREVMPHFR